MQQSNAIMAKQISKVYDQKIGHQKNPPFYREILHLILKERLPLSLPFCLWPPFSMIGVLKIHGQGYFLGDAGGSASKGI